LKLVVTGSIAFDYLMSFSGQFSEHLLPDKLDSISVSFLVDSLVKRRGGCAGNIAYNLALLGERPYMWGAVGKDFSDYQNHLNSTGVDTTGVFISEKDLTASFFANTDKNGNQIASFYTGAMQHAKDLSLKKWKNQDALVLISPNDPEAMRAYVKECQALDIAYVYDPGQQIVCLGGDDLKKGMERAAIFILNDYEFEMCKKKTGLSDDAIFQNVGTTIITHGDKGSLLVNQEGKFQIPIAKPKKVLDPTGVGDAFRAGLLKGFIHGLPWHAAGRMGSLASAYVLETDGPQSHTYDLKSFLERYEKTFGSEEALQKLR